MRIGQMARGPVRVALIRDLRRQVKSPRPAEEDASPARVLLQEFGVARWAPRLSTLGYSGDEEESCSGLPQPLSNGVISRQTSCCAACARSLRYSLSYR